LAYAQKARESYNEEQISLCERMVEYKKQSYQESRLSLNGPYGSPSADNAHMHPFSRISSSVIDAVAESAANGKVFQDMMFFPLLHFIILSFHS
jgi:Arf-GAP/coiled-coil/ANK repeat/PH domain-containing protein